MHYKFYIALSLALAAVLTAAAALDAPLWVVGALGAALVAVLLLLWRSVRRPMDAVQNGLYLLRSQDFASRLAPTGQADADRVVEMFNRMTDTLKAERLKNREQESLLGKLIEVSPNGIAICDFDGRVVQTNQAFRRMADGAVMAVLDSLGDDRSQTLRQPDGRVYSVRRLWFMDSGFRRRFYIVYPLTDEIVEAERQVYSKMMRIIGHEVNNTLGSTMSVLETLGAGHDEDTLERMAADSCLSSCEHLVDFVRRYAQLAKLPEPQLEPVQLEQMVSGLLPQLQALTDANTLLSMKVEGATATVQLDPALIERVLVNVVKNAAESVVDRPDGCITLHVRGRRLEVANNGRGITQAESERLFTPFYSTKHPDRGLGLMLVADILRAHGATFNLATGTDGITRFEVAFK